MNGWQTQELWWKIEVRYSRCVIEGINLSGHHILIFFLPSIQVILQLHNMESFGFWQEPKFLSLAMLEVAPQHYQC